MKIRPMRGVAPEKDLPEETYLVSPKVDGLRAVVKEGVVYSKTMKPIPNGTVQKMFGHLHGKDGELTVGLAYKEHEGDDVYDRSRGPIMRKVCEADFRFNIFDRWDMPDVPAIDRINSISLKNESGVEVVTHLIADSSEAVDRAYQHYLDRNFEGAMLRIATGKYKFGQSTEKEGYLLKLKKFVDGEAIVISVFEQMENTNTKETNELGYSKRSSAKAGKVGKGTFGSFLVKDLITGVEFSVGNGPGLTHDLRAKLWFYKDKLPNQIIRYRFQEIGTKNAPRLPQFAGFRHPIDLEI